MFKKVASEIKLIDLEALPIECIVCEDHFEEQTIEQGRFYFYKERQWVIGI